jgi:hypothetical protein
VDLLGLTAAAAVLALGVLAPGLAVARGLQLARDPLARLVIGAAIGRLAFAAVALLATVSAGAPVLFAWLAVAGGASLALAWRWRRQGRSPAGAEPRAAWLVPAAAAGAAAALLVHAVVARSGLADPRGDLLFYGRDSTNDPLVYGAMALRLAAEGLPLQLPFAGGGPGPAPYLSYAVLAGLWLTSGADVLDLAFRVVPLFDAVLASLAAVSLARALGGGPLAAGVAGVLLALGGDAGALVAPLGAALGRSIQPLDSWALFGPYLAAFNPIAAATHTWLAACVLVAGLRGGERATPLVAGLLVAALFELKLFLWAPAVAALVLVAFARPPIRVAPPLRRAALVALVGSLPSLADRALWVFRLHGRDETAFQICVGCLPRYLADAAWGSHELSFASFRVFRTVHLLDPGVLVATAVASLLVLATALGARAFALPVLREGRRDESGRGVALRMLGAAAGLGLCGAFAVVTAPHYLNGAQFAWAATFGLWPLAALQLERLWRGGPRAACVALALLAFASTAHVLGPLGYRAPLWQRVGAEERELLAHLPPTAGPRDAVLEPSMLADTDRASPVPWLTGHPVYLSLLSAVQSLPAAERERRFVQIATVFVERDRAAALEAIRASAVGWVYAPAAFPLRFEPGDALEVVARSPAGTLYRVPGAPGGGGR